MHRGSIFEQSGEKFIAHVINKQRMQYALAGAHSKSKKIR
jgi:hypothetical protein